MVRELDEKRVVSSFTFVLLLVSDPEGEATSVRYLIVWPGLYLVPAMRPSRARHAPVTRRRNDRVERQREEERHGKSRWESLGTSRVVVTAVATRAAVVATRVAVRRAD